MRDVVDVRVLVADVPVLFTKFFQPPRHSVVFEVCYPLMKILSAVLAFEDDETLGTPTDVMTNPNPTTCKHL